LFFVFVVGNEELVLSETAKIPEIKNPKDILIEIHAAGVNPIDVRMRGKLLQLYSLFSFVNFSMILITSYPIVFKF
jgi:NADPH:quinone reductase-like Zn-dependent oxidoreductase